MEKRENIWLKSRTVIPPPGARATDGGAGPLYRSPAPRWIDYCERELGVAVTLVEGYGPREYTLLARK